MDLSIRDFLERRTDDIVHNTRSGYRVWYNPLFNAPEQRQANSIEDTQDLDDGEAPERDAQYLDKIGMPLPEVPAETQIDPLLQQQAGREADAQEAQAGRTVEEIQILELHSKDPVVLYRNHVFRGTWAENIGTEMIFTKQTPEAPLPAICDLGRNIHLLATSSARINFKEVTLIAKEKFEASNQTETMDSYDKEDDIPERYKRNGGIYVHIGGDKSGQRQPQAHFLEDLIALKRKRGEMDEVTIQPLETKQNKLMVDDVEEERRRQKLQVDYERNLRWRALRKGDTDFSSTIEDQYITRQRTHEGEPTTVKPRKRGGPGSRPRIRRAPLIRRQSPPREPQVPQQNRDPVGEELSTPTPGRWDDLHQPGNANTKES